MGRPKLLLPVGGSTVLARVVTAVRAAGVEDVLVVVGPDGDALGQLARDSGADVLRLAHDTPDMRATCLAGLAHLEARHHPTPGDSWLLLPADHPTVRPGVVAAILDAARRDPKSVVVVPTHGGKRGHPAWLRWSLVDELRALPEGQGLNALVRAKAGETVELGWPSDEVVRDLDTPEDYERLLREEAGA